MAQAAFVDVSGMPSPDSSGASSIRVAVDGGSVTLEARQQVFGAGTYASVARSVSADVRIVRFDGGPVVLRGVVFNGATDAQALLIGPDGMASTAGDGATSGMQVSEIWAYAADGSAGAMTGVGFDWMNGFAQPIPEPSAALLFATGLVVFGSSVRRR